MFKPGSFGRVSIHFTPISALWALGGLVGPYFLLLYVALWTLDVYLLQSYLTFSGSINQGDFNDGHRVIAEYFWHAEGAAGALAPNCERLISARTRAHSSRGLKGLVR